jgi:catechol 2,3-dioxygenase-like lactoylglutathione lyase family enzyme
MITSVSHINRAVRDLDRTIAFYTQNLGFYIGLGDVLFELGVSQDVEAATASISSRLGLTVTDLDAVVADLRSKGVEIVEEPAEMRTFNGRQAAIRDPDGYVIALREWRAPDGPHYAGWQPRHEGVVRLA